MAYYSKREKIISFYNYIVKAIDFIIIIFLTKNCWQVYSHSLVDLCLKVFETKENYFNRKIKIEAIFFVFFNVEKE